MSAPAPAPTKQLTRAERALLAVSGRLGACVACACERFEPSQMMDGFAMCVCHHTQWGHP